MNKKISIIVILIIIFGLFLILKDKDNVDEINIDRSEEAFVERIPVQHKYGNGKHTLYGVISAPTPCHELSIDSNEENGEVMIDITLTEGEDMCTQVITDKPFIYSFEADEDSVLLGALNGKLVSFTITELEEGSEFDLEEFMFKG